MALIIGLGYQRGRLNQSGVAAMNGRIYVKLMLSAFFWGSSVVAGKYALQIYRPSEISFFRFFIAAVIMFFLVNPKKAIFVISPRNHLRLFILSLAGVTLCYYFSFNGLHLSSAFNTGIIEATTPLLTLLIAVVCGMERMTFNQLAGLITAYLGIGITISNGSWQALVNADYNSGDILILLSTLCFAIYNILTRKWQLAIPDRVFMFYFFFYGCLALLPWLILDAGNRVAIPWYDALRPLPLFSILFMAAGGSVVAYLFFNQGISAIGVSKAASFINLVPLVTVFLSVGLLGETAGVSQWLGAVIILAGVFLANKGIAKKKGAMLLAKKPLKSLK
ncbi:DMT family transporter [Brenneria goodwinii]|nr:DMT family transporter [Brenneria goodwinii]